MKRRVDLRRISGYSAVALAGFYSTGVFLIPPLFGSASEAFLLSPAVLVSYWGGVTVLALTYIVESFERLETTEEQILMREFQGIETYHNADAFLARLIDVSVGAESISTLNFSPPAGASRALDGYFVKLNSYITANGRTLKSFRSIASIENPGKADWIVERSTMYFGNSSVSLASFREHSALRLMCYHVVMKDGVGYVFFYPPIPLTGVMSAFLIVNTKIAQLMKEQFDLAWAKSVPVLQGGRVHCEGLALLKDRGANARAPNFLRLQSEAKDDNY